MSNEAIRKDEGKLRHSFVTQEFLDAMAGVLTHGAKKYESDHQWRKGMDWSRTYDATLRHIGKWRRKEDIDPESGFPHIIHAAVNLMFLHYYGLYQIGNDDRVPDA